MKPMFDEMLQKGISWFAKKSVHGMDTILIWTTALGWASSSFFHCFGILHNDNYSKDQKKFMLKQEISDAVTNIGLYLGFTVPFRNFAETCVNTGKIRTTGVKDAMGGRDTVRSVERLLEQRNPELLEDFIKFRGSVKTLTALGVGLIASNIVTPWARNNIAAWLQNREINKNGAKPIYKPTKSVNNKPVQSSTIPNLYNGRTGYTFNMPANGNGGVKI